MSSKKERIPKWLDAQYAPLGFRRAKRKQIRLALSVMDDLVTGCAFMPRGQEYARGAEELLEKLRAACTTRRWGR